MAANRRNKRRGQRPGRSKRTASEPIRAPEETPRHRRFVDARGGWRTAAALIAGITLLALVACLLGRSLPRKPEKDNGLATSRTFQVGPSAGGPSGEFERKGILLLAWDEADSDLDRVYHKIIKTVQDRIEICLLFRDNEHRRQINSKLEEIGVSNDSVAFLHVPFDSRWIRDYGPIDVKQSNGDILLADPDYLMVSPLRPQDDSVPRGLAASFDVPVVRLPLTMDGGLLITNGRGLGVASQGFVPQNTFWQYDQKGVDAVLKTCLRLNEIAFMEPLSGEPTGHVDVFAAFVKESTVLVGEYLESQDPENARILQRNAELLSRYETPSGPLKIVRIPMPAHQDGVWRSFTNVVLANGVLLVPAYPETDPIGSEGALEVYRSLLPDWDVVPVDCEALCRKGGNLHCITQTLPQSIGLVDQPRLTEPTVIANAGQESTTSHDSVVRFLETIRQSKPLSTERLRALETISQVGLDAVPTLADELKSETSEIRAEAAFLLVANGSEAAPAIPALISALSDPNWRVRWFSMVALGKIGSPAVPSLVKACENPATRKSALFSLRIAGAQARTAVPVLTKSLDSHDWQERAWAAACLGDIGRNASGALAELRRVLKVEVNDEVRETIRNAVTRINRHDNRTSIPTTVEGPQSVTPEGPRIR